MGSTNHGTQAITWQYFMDAKAYDFNKKDVNVIPRGIYQGGHLTKVGNSEITLSPLTVVLGDNDVQVSVKTEDFATLKAGSPYLDSGTISADTPYIVLRWAFAESISNYMEVHALAEGDIQTNDIVVGKCVISGGGVLDPVFDYTSRTFLNVQDLFLKPIVNEDGGLYIWVSAGKIQNSTGSVFVPEQRVGPFSVPNSPNSRIDLVYVDTDGSIKIQTGTAAVSPTVPAYAGKMVIAEVRLVYGESSIPITRIIDVRNFITSFVGVATTEFHTDGTVFSVNVPIGTWVELNLSSKIGAAVRLVVLMLYHIDYAVTSSIIAVPYSDRISWAIAGYSRVEKEGMSAGGFGGVNATGFQTKDTKSMLMAYTDSSGKLALRTGYTGAEGANWKITLIGYV